jgi:hypothetical protein
MNPINFDLIVNAINKSLSENAPIDLVLYSITISLVIFIIFPKFTYTFTAVSIIPILANYIDAYSSNILKQTIESHIIHLTIIMIMFVLILQCITKSIIHN